MLLTDDDETNDTNGWIALALTGIGFIPVLGSAVKGVGKVIVENAGEVLAPALAVLREMGKGDPVKFLQNLEWPELTKQAVALIKEKVLAIRDALLSILDSKATWVLSEAAEASIQTNADKLTKILPEIEQGVTEGVQEVEKRLNKALNEYQGELAHVGKTGDINKVKTDELIAPKGNELKGAPPRINELEQGKKGGWNKQLNGKLEASATYKVGKYTYKTDELGRVKSVGGELDLSKVDRNTYQQGKAGKTDGIKDGLTNDEGGHLIASIFKGPGEQINYAAMDGNLNKGAWKRMENKWAEALKGNPPKKVEVEIKSFYEEGSKRPKKFIVKYLIDGEPFKTVLKNKPGGK